MSLSFVPSSPTTTHENHLTSRETELIRLVVEGLKDEQISARLEVSLSKMRLLIGSVNEKLGVSDRLELIIHAIHHGIAKSPI